MPCSLDSFKDMLANIAYGNNRQDAIKNSTCVKCKEFVNPEIDFKDEISRKEFVISQLCYKCQCEVFG
jgi:hypothetical protein